MMPKAERCSRKVKLDKSSLLIEKAIGDGDDVRKKVQKAATNNIDTLTLSHLTFALPHHHHHNNNKTPHQSIRG